MQCTGQAFYVCKHALGGSIDGALYIYGWANTNYNVWDSAYWKKTARAGSYIYRFDAANMSHVASNTALFAGVLCGSCSGWESGFFRQQRRPIDGVIGRPSHAEENRD